MTTTYPSGATGRDVKEADVELNAVRFWFALGDDRKAPAALETAAKRPASLHATLVHELGHALGLPDACASHTQSGAMRNADCPQAARDSVMFAPAHLERPTSIDVDNLCALLAGESGGDTGGRSFPMGTAPGPVMIALLAVIALGLVWMLRARTPAGRRR
jgi:hypothetical protein